MIITLSHEIVKLEFPAQFPCTSVIGTLLNNIQNAKCSFLSSISLISYDFKYFHINMTLGLVMNPSYNLHAMCTNNYGCGQTTIDTDSIVNLLVNDNPIVPTVVIRARDRFSLCDNLRFDLTSTTGSAGRPWRIVNVSIILVGYVLQSHDEQLLIETLQATFQDQFSAISPIIISRDLVMASRYPYEMSVFVCNIFDRCGSAKFIFNVTNSSLLAPLIQIAGTPHRSITRSSSLVLMSSISTSECSNPVSNIQVSWLVWNVSTDNIRIAINPNLKSTSKDAMKFTLPRNSLSVNKMFEMQVTAMDMTSGLFSTSSIFVTVLQSPLVASLNPNKPILLLATGGSPIEVNGWLSYDPDEVIDATSYQSVDDIESRLSFR